MSLQVGQCLSAKVLKSSVTSSRLKVHGQYIESKSGVAHADLSDGVRQGGEGIWCGLCGDGEGWLTCGRCMGEGGFPTRPGLAGVKGKVGWGRCKTCFGQTVVPCLLCGVSGVAEWKLWVEHARRHPREIGKRTIAP